MFTDGLHNRVDVYKLNRNLSNRTVKGDVKLPTEPNERGVPCRIIRDEKILFAGDVVLSDGDTVRDADSGIVYEVRGTGKRVRGVSDTHHSSYGVVVKRVGDLVGNRG